MKDKIGNVSYTAPYSMLDNFREGLHFPPIWQAMYSIWQKLPISYSLQKSMWSSKLQTMLHMSCWNYFKTTISYSTSRQQFACSHLSARYLIGRLKHIRFELLFLCNRPTGATAESRTRPLPTKEHVLACRCQRNCRLSARGLRNAANVALTYGRGARAVCMCYVKRELDKAPPSSLPRITFFLGAASDWDGWITFGFRRRHEKHGSQKYYRVTSPVWDNILLFFIWEFRHIVHLTSHFCQICCCPSRSRLTSEQSNQSQQNVVSNRTCHPVLLNQIEINKGKGRVANFAVKRTLLGGSQWEMSYLLCGKSTECTLPHTVSIRKLHICHIKCMCNLSKKLQFNFCAEAAPGNPNGKT